LNHPVLGTTLARTCRHPKKLKIFSGPRLKPRTSQIWSKSD